MVCFAPSALSLALTGRLDRRAPEVKKAMTQILNKCREMAVIALVFTNDVNDAKALVAGGCDVVAAGTDAGWFAQAAAQARAAATSNS